MRPFPHKSAPRFAGSGWIRTVASIAACLISVIFGCTPASAVQPDRAGARGADSDYSLHGGCEVPLGDTILASSSSAIVFASGLPYPDFWTDNSYSFYGCLRSVGRDRLLEHFVGDDYDSAYYVSSAVVNGTYGGLVEGWQNSHYGGQWSKLQVFDLRTGSLDHKLGHEETWCPNGIASGVTRGRTGCLYGGIDRVVLGSDGVSAVHVIYYCDGAVPCYTKEAIVASDAAGTRKLDSGKFPGNGHFLTDLKLIGDVLSWDHDGSLRSVVLTPPPLLERAPRSLAQTR